MTFVQESSFGLGSLWIIGWAFYFNIATAYCFNIGVSLYTFFTALQGGDVPKAYQTGIDFCYGTINQFY
jgi:hypothetical protein